jgi:hypothetical protein
MLEIPLIMIEKRRLSIPHLFYKYQQISSDVHGYLTIDVREENEKYVDMPIFLINGSLTQPMYPAYTKNVFFCTEQKFSDVCNRIRASKDCPEYGPNQLIVKYFSYTDWTTLELVRLTKYPKVGKYVVIYIDNHSRIGPLSTDYTIHIPSILEKDSPMPLDFTNGTRDPFTFPLRQYEYVIKRLMSNIS